MMNTLPQKGYFPKYKFDKAQIFFDILMKCAETRTSRDFGGYWQGNKRLMEHLVH